MAKGISADPGRRAGIASAVVAGLLFGTSTPIAHLLLRHTSPWMLAGLLYLGSGLGLTVVRWFQRRPAPRLDARSGLIVASAVTAG
ncbi:MAG TPA: hypothetical protein VFN52_02145, partial [Acidiferrobacteraceae bacterium]|nr:hypothetical protein [Acidiferrobacteraceae bacterium]